MTRKPAKPLTRSQIRQREQAEKVTQALDDAGYLAEDAYRPHVAIEIRQALKEPNHV